MTCGLEKWTVNEAKRSGQELAESPSHQPTMSWEEAGLVS